MVSSASYFHVQNISGIIPEKSSVFNNSQTLYILSEILGALLVNFYRFTTTDTKDFTRDTKGNTKVDTKDNSKDDTKEYSKLQIFLN